MGRTLLFIVFAASPWFYGWFELFGQPIALTDLLLPICVLTWLLQRRATGSNALALPLLAFGLAAALSVVAPVTNGQPWTAILKAGRLLGILAPAVLLSTERCAQEDWVRYLQAFFWGGLLSLGIGIAGFFLQWESLVAAQTYLYGNGAYLHRAGGVFRDSGAFGHLLATWVAMSLMLLLPELAARQRLMVLLTVAVVGAVGLYTSVSRSAALNIITVLVLASVLRRSAANVSLWRPLTVAALAVLLTGGVVLVADPEASGVVWQAGETMAQRMIEIFTPLSGGVDDIERASGGRLTTWATALDAWSEHPVLGVGYKIFALGGHPPDNSFILALCETGMIGFAGLAFFYGSVFWRAIRLFIEGEPDGRRFLILWTGQLAHSLNADIFTFFGSATPLLAITLIWLRLTSQTRQVSRASIPAAARLTYHRAG